MKKLFLLGVATFFLYKCDDINSSGSDSSQNLASTVKLKKTIISSTNQYFSSDIITEDKNSGVSSIAGDGSAIFYAHQYDSDGYMYKIQNSSGYLQIVNGAYWRYIQGMASLGQYLYVIENGYLVRIDKKTNEFKRIGSRLWAKTQSMTASNTHLFIVHNDNLYRIDPNGPDSYEWIGRTYWKYTGGMAFDPSSPDSIYILENGSINKVSGVSGNSRRFGPVGYWPNARGLTYLNGYLYVLNATKLWRISVSNPSSVEEIPRDIPSCDYWFMPISNRYGTTLKRVINCTDPLNVRNALTTSGNSIYYWASTAEINAKSYIFKVTPL